MVPSPFCSIAVLTVHLMLKYLTASAQIWQEAFSPPHTWKHGKGLMYEEEVLCVLIACTTNSPAHNL